jgi:YVTN family beta-propeller protein
MNDPGGRSTTRRGARCVAFALTGIALLITGTAAIAAGTTAVISLTGTTYTYDVAFSPDGATAYATLEGDNKVSLIDVATRNVITTIASPGGVLDINTPRGIAATDDRVFVASSGNNYVGVINRATSTYEARVLIPGTNLGGNSDLKTIAIDVASNRAYVLRRSLPSGTGSANGSLTIFDTATLEVIGSPLTGFVGANDVALSADGATAYVASRAGSIIVIDTATMRVTRTITVSGSMGAVAADPRGGYLYALDINPASGADPGHVEVIDLGLAQAVRTVVVEDATEDNDIVISADGRHLYASNRWGCPSSCGIVTELDVADPLSASIVSTYSAEGAYGIGISPNGAHVYTALNSSPGKVMALTMDAPGAPTQAAATVGVESATVSWMAPTADGGAPIISYTVTAVEDPTKSCVTRAALPNLPAVTCTVTGLTAGTSYTFTVVARNGAGAGAASAATNAVVPTGASAAASTAPSTSGAPSDQGAAAPSSLRVVSATGAGREVVIRLRVSGPGRLTLRGTVPGAGAQRVRVCEQRMSTRRAGTVTLICSLNLRGRALLAESALAVRVAVAFAPTAGTARSAIRIVRLPALAPTPPQPVTG